MWANKTGCRGFCWRVLALLLVLLVVLLAGCTQQPARLQWVSKPMPKLPKQVPEGGYATVLYQVHHDGSVSDVRVEHASDARIGRAAEQAVRRWVFKPWVVTPERPESVRARVPMMFAPRTYQPAILLN